MPEARMKTFKRILRQSALGARLIAVRSQWRDGRHRRKMQRFYAQFIKSGTLCFDAGANVGNRTEVFRSLGARVIAIEPQSACLTRLRERFDLDSDVVIVPMGLSSAPGTASLAVSNDSSTIASLSPEFRQKWRWSDKVHWQAEELVELTTLDELIKRFGIPDFCKIDVEGFEHQVLSGLSQPIRALSFEFNIEFIGQAQECIQKLKSLNYRRFNYSTGESMCLDLGEWVGGDQLVQVLKSQNDPLFWGDVYVSK